MSTNMDDSAWLALLFKYLSAIIKKNNTRISLSIDPRTSNFNQLIKTIEQEKIYMWIKHFAIHCLPYDSIDYLKYIVFNNPNLECLSLMVDDTLPLAEFEFQAEYKQNDNNNDNNNNNNNNINNDSSGDTIAMLSSLQVLILSCTPGAIINIYTINALLKLKLIESNRLFIRAHFETNMKDSNCNLNDFDKIFELICSRLCSMMMKKRIPFDVRVAISHKSDHERCLPIFSRHFGNQNLKGYKHPIASGNQHFKPMLKPNVSYKSQEGYGLIVQNATYSS